MDFYKKAFTRNLGILSKKDQDKIKEAKILVVGCGGIGGWASEFLVRLGVVNIVIADPEEFEISNINRQCCSDSGSLGKNKASIIGDYLRLINPDINISVVKEGINKENTVKLVEECDLIIDTIDFYSVEEEILLHNVANNKGKWVFLSQVAGSKATFTYFSPNRSGKLEEYITKDSKVSFRKTIRFFFPELPAESGKIIIARILKGEKAVIPSVITKPVITASILVEDVLSYIIGKKVISIPEIGIYDFIRRDYKVINRS